MSDMTREEAIEVFKTEHPYNPKRKDNDLHTLAKAFDLAISALSADVKPNIHATWEKVSADKYIQSANYRYRCSMCGELTIGEPNFCPTCGADMRGKENE